MSAEIGDRIRPFRSPQDFRHCVSMQQLVWGFDHTDVVSVQMLRSSISRGGVVLGHFDDSDWLNGFVYSFPAPFGSAVIQHSHMLAVHPAYRDSGIGNALKWAQYRRAQELGNPLITWTFDPLEARNAHLNLNKLGVRIRRYYVNLYGEATSSPLHAGVGTDRFLAEWQVTSSALESFGGKLPPAALPKQIRALDSAPTASGHRMPLEPDLSMKIAELAVEIPAYTQRMKQDNLELAVRWRQATRRVLQHYLQNGYVVCGLWVVQENPWRTFFCLRNDQPPD